jgi:carbonic anhydrase
MKPGEERSSSNHDLLERLTIRNVEQAIVDIRNQSSMLRNMEKNGEIIITGANYDVETGEVFWL